MAERVVAKLPRNGFSGFRTMTLTVRFSDFDTRNRSRTVKSGIAIDNTGNALSLIKTQALDLLVPFFDARENPRGKAIRLIGLRLEKLF
jgi:nucleotidyltransferase/DNA polymerase involved in DNA repair